MQRNEDKKNETNSHPEVYIPATFQALNEKVQLIEEPLDDAMEEDGQKVDTDSENSDFSMEE